MQLTTVLIFITVLDGSEIKKCEVKGCEYASLLQQTMINASIMRKIDTIIIHCSATKEGQDFTAADIERWHRARGINGIGYHYVIRLDGKIEKGRDLNLVGAHCRGWNARSIGICYIGGLDANGTPADTRTGAQKRVLYQLVKELLRVYPSIDCVMGHRDASPDLNGNGVIEPWEFVKACPCFDVKEWLRTGRTLLYVWTLALAFPLLLGACKSGKPITDRRMMEDSVTWLLRGGSTTKEAGQRQDVHEWVDERMEQTVFAWEGDATAIPKGGDAEVNVLKSRPLIASVTKTVVDRKRQADVRVKTTERLESTDSLQTAYRRSKTDEKNETHPDPWKRWGTGLLLIMVLLMSAVWFVRKKFF